MFCQCFDLSNAFISPISSSLDKRERKTSLWRILCDTRLKIMFCWCFFFSIDYLIICFHRRHIVWNIPWRKSIKGNLGRTSSCRANGCGGLPSWEHQTKQGHFCLVVCLFVDAAPTLIIDNFTTCIVVTPCDRLTANHTLGHSSTKELFSPLSQVGVVLESAEPAWAEEDRRAYHAFSRLRSKGRI